MKVYNVNQKSDDWFSVRERKMTASQASKIVSDGLEKYIKSLFQEKKFFTNNDIERGVELEEEVRKLYEEKFEKVTEVGFIERDEYSGCSPDGLVGEKGGIEIKCPNDKNFEKILKKGEKGINKIYFWQVQMCLLVTGREWWDLVIYNKNFEMLVFRQFPKMEMQEKLLLGLEKGKNLIKKYEHTTI